MTNPTPTPTSTMLPKPKRGGGIRLHISLGTQHYIGSPRHTASSARNHLKRHPEVILHSAEQWQQGRYVQVDIGSDRQPVPQIEGGHWQ